MAWRLNDFVECGELINTRNYSTHGWLKLRGREQSVQLDLTGNASPDLAGWRIRFQSHGPRAGAGGEPSPEELAEFLAQKTPDLAPHQIGATGDISAARKVKTADCSVRELIARSRAGEPPPFRWVQCLYLEWYSQNGRVVAEILDPVIEYVDFQSIPGVSADTLPPKPEGEEEPPTEGGLEVAEVRLDDKGKPHVTHHFISAEGDHEVVEEEPDDPYNLFTPEAGDDAANGPTDSGEAETVGAIVSFLGPLPLPEDLDDAEVEGHLKGALSALAMYGIALRVCEHYSIRETYRLLRNTILPKERAHPELGLTQFTTADYCGQCQAASPSGRG